MDTVATISAETARPEEAVEAAPDRALRWFGTVEQICSHFDPESELAWLCRQLGLAMPVSGLLFEAVAVALEVAQLTRGEPQVRFVRDHRMQTAGGGI